MSTLTFPIETAREFRVLFELCRLAGNRPENPVEMTTLSKTADIGNEYFDHSIESLMAAKLAEFDNQVGNLRVTRYGISEIITAKACPNSRTNYFPSINSMRIRLCRGHHLFDDVEPLWPKELSKPEKSASPGQSSNYLPDNKPAKSVRKKPEPDDNRLNEPVADSGQAYSRAAIITQMITELEELVRQLGTMPTEEAHRNSRITKTKHSSQNKDVVSGEHARAVRAARPIGPAAQNPENNRKAPQQNPPLPKTRPIPAPGTYPSLLFNSNQNAGSSEKSGGQPAVMPAEVDVIAWMRENPLGGRKPINADQTSEPEQIDSSETGSTTETGNTTKTSNVTETGSVTDGAATSGVGNAFDQLCNLINANYAQSSSKPDKRSLVRRRQLLRELEAVNESLFSFAWQIE